MVFVDILTGQLFSLTFVGLLLAYMAYRALVKGKRAAGEAASASIPLFALSIYIIVSGLFGQFAWTLPGSYNILFYDVYVMLGLIVFSIAWCMRSGMRLQYTGLFGLISGLLVAYYGIEGYMLHMTQSPIALLGLYGLFGLSGVLGYPVTLMADGAKRKSGTMVLILYAFIVVIVLASLLAAFIGVESIPAHLASPP